MRNRLFLLMLVAALGFSLNPILAKMVADELTYSGILLFRFLCVILFLPVITILVTDHTLKSFFSITKRGLIEFFFLGVFFAGNILLFYFSFNYIDVNRALFISFTYPVFTVIFARIFLKENATMEELTSVGLVIIGSGFLFWGSDLSGGTLIGDLMVLVSVLFWAGYVVLNRYTALREVHHRQTFWIFLFSAVLILPFFMGYDYSSPLNLSLNSLGILLIIGTFSTLFPYSIMNYCAKHMRSTVIGIFILLSMVITIFLSFIFLGEPVEKNAVLGGMFIVIASIISVLEFKSVFILNAKIKARIKQSTFLSLLKKIFRKRDLEVQE